MISRRAFGLGIAGTVAPAMSRCLSAPKRVQAEFIAYAMPTEWNPIKALGKWPLDHTAVWTSGGMEWGCFGRTYSDAPSLSAPVARGWGDELWAKAIAGPDGHAAIDYGVTGVCDQCSNRILLPAGIDVRNSPGNEIATLFCGVYGLGLKEFIVRIKDAAVAVNRDHAGRISEEDVVRAIRRVDGGLASEWEIVRTDIERIVRPALAAQEYEAAKADIEGAYLSLFYKRQAMFGAYVRGRIDKKVLADRVTQAFIIALEDLKAIIGEPSFRKIVPVPPEVAADYVFHQKD